MVEKGIDVFEVPQDSVQQSDYDYWQNLIDTNVCAECGARLTIKTYPDRKSIGIGCPNGEHQGLKTNTSLTQDFRRGIPVHPSVENRISTKMFDERDIPRAMNLLALRFPKIIKDQSGAALFINDCLRLNLDPLIQPAEAIPITFKSKDANDKEKISVSMIITEDGYLSMAARACPNDYDGPPATMPLLNYLMREYPNFSMDELKELRRSTAEELCGDPDAWVWVAIGKRRSANTAEPVYGFFTQAEHKAAFQNKLPAGNLPGNQARVRAIKRWARETFPESRSKMVEHYNMLEQSISESEDSEIKQIIDAEYKIITTSIENKPVQSLPRGTTKKTSSKSSKKEEEGEALSLEDKKVVDGKAETKSERDEPSSSFKNKQSANSGMAGFFEIDKIKEMMKGIKWSETTAVSWISSKFKIPSNGNFEEVVSKLNREQAQIFWDELISKSKVPF